MRTSLIRTHPQRLAVCGHGFRQPAVVFQCVAPCGVRVGVVQLSPQRLAILRQRIPQVLMGYREGGLYAERLTEFLDALVPHPLPYQAGAQGAVGNGVVGT